MSIIELDTRLLQALQQPLLAYRDIDQYRQQMTLYFAENVVIQASLPKSTFRHSAFSLGAQSATPGMAFLSGYQSALRCLDPACPADQFAAFCVSEKGIKKPWDMKTRLTRADSGWVLKGQKGFVMLLPNPIDRLYVVTKQEDDALSCVLVNIGAAGLSVAEPLNAPFIQDIPHAGVVFDQVVVEEANILTTQAHQQANKPFRYWEDVHVAIAMTGWMLRKLSENSKLESHKVGLLELICQLIEKFEEEPDYYSLEGLDLLDECHQLLDVAAVNLSASALSLWKQDRLLLQMGLKIRHQIRMKLSQ